jgi:hypothetical protein
VKRVIWLVFLCAAASCVAASAAEPSAGKSPAKTASAKATTRVAVRQPAVADLAPADEYFGPFKLSIIGIRNTLRDVGLRYDFNHDIGTQTYKSAQQTEKSIRDWERRYPRDDQLPRAVYLLQRLYTKVLVSESRARAHVVAVWLFTDFAKSPQSKQLKKTIALEHLAPIPAATATPATPSPVSDTHYQSTFGGNYPSNFNPTPAPATTTPATKSN